MNLVRLLKIRSRLTLGSIAIAAVVLTIALVGARAEVSSIFMKTNISLATSDLTSYAEEIAKSSTDLVDDSGKGILIAVRDPSGRQQLDTLPHEIHEVIEHREGSDQTFTVDVDGTSFVVVSELLDTSRGQWSLWAARSQASAELSLHSLDSVFLIGALLLLLAFGVASWLLAAAALRPVERLRSQADRLGVDSAETLPVNGTRDEISQLAQTLNRFVERVRASAAREKQMVSDAAHELRTPLAALKTQLELAHDDFADPAALATQIMAAENSVTRLSALATNLLQLSRLESGPNDDRSSSPDDLIAELMASVDRARLIGLARAADVSYEIEVTDQSGRYRISSENFSRLLDNLLANAIDAVSRDGSVRILLANDSAGCRIVVCDDGPGMSAAFLPRAFDRFSRADDSRTESTGGSGLGLALVQAVVLSANGSVTIDNLTGPNDHSGLVVTGLPVTELTVTGLSVTVLLPRMTQR